MTIVPQVCRSHGVLRLRAPEEGVVVDAAPPQVLAGAAGGRLEPVGVLGVLRMAVVRPRLN